ncbi:MAG: hypothetical protein EOO11_10555 [Chitinophagaceae bacterium]|nr:MAG: hypothetical protein EOO11_10555 [Chitinophagaceae bacterium]
MRSSKTTTLAPLALLAVLVLLFLLPSKGLHAVSAAATVSKACDTTAPQPVRVRPVAPVQKQAALPFPLNYFRYKDSTGREFDLYGRPVGC